MHEENDDKNNKHEEVEYVAEDSGDFQDEDAQDATPEQKIKKLREKITRLQKEKEEYLEGWQRERAAFTNFQKDEAKRRDAMRAFASEDMALGIAEVLDSFALARGQAPPEIQQHAWFAGMQHIEKQMQQILSRYGVEEIAIQEGDMFNPSEHEAIGQEESDRPSGTILEVFQKGYKIGNRVVRPARVKVAK